MLNTRQFFIGSKTFTREPNGSRLGRVMAVASKNGLIGAGQRLNIIFWRPSAVFLLPGSIFSFRPRSRTFTDFTWRRGPTDP